MSAMEEKPAEVPEEKVEKVEETEGKEAVPEAAAVVEETAVKTPEPVAGSAANEGDKALPPWRERAGEIITHSCNVHGFHSPA